LVTPLQSRIESVQATIARASQDIATMQPYSVTATLPPQIDALRQRERDLNRQLASAQQTKKELEGRRDLYWDSYRDVSKRLNDVTQGLRSINQVSENV